MNIDEKEHPVRKNLYDISEKSTRKVVYGATKAPVQILEKLTIDLEELFEE
ncbi:MAG: hypothetical protein LBE56_07455 [Tannerella sp.]|jgi:hypothetical protein|nr:hypothetical protein [Tannerella sp.]